MSILQFMHLYYNQRTYVSNTKTFLFTNIALLILHSAKQLKALDQCIVIEGLCVSGLTTFVVYSRKIIDTVDAEKFEGCNS